MGVKGCWTCRGESTADSARCVRVYKTLIPASERKVRCDSRLPRCNNCIKANRVCKGYGMQLSWPRNGDRKRAIISRDTNHALNTRRPDVKRFLHASSWDVSLSEELGDGQVSARHLRTMKVTRPPCLCPAVVSQEESHLLDFFHGSRSLVLGPTDEEVLTQFILKVAFSEPSNATNPVLQSIFALASLQLQGSSKSFRYKHLAVSSVAKQTVDWLDAKTLLQNLMAAMLLYHYELSLGSSSRGGWVVFFCAVKRIINTAPAVHKLIQQEYSVFLDWIFYHEVMSEFTVRHWKVPYDGCGFTPISRSPKAIDGVASKVEDNIGCPTNVLQLVVHACESAIITPPSPMDSTKADMGHTHMLEQNILQAVRSYGHLTGQSTTPSNRNTMISDLHRLACLIYVNRAIHRVTEPDFRHRQLVREGVLLLTNMTTCQSAWPLFIIACEAVDDDQRLAILDVFEQSRQDRRRRSSHIHLIQQTVEAVWKQHDLDTENEVGYLTILDAVIGAVPFMPVFA